MITFPNAKINIGLNIINRRSDGYHNIETIFYPISIKDALEVIESDELRFTSTGITVPGNAGDNLCLKAYHLISQDVHIPPVHIHLHKHIPIGAGLGGGSADAAFLIKLLNDKFTLELNIEQMEAYAMQLGADCAFFIRNEPTFAFEVGDVFKDIKLNLTRYFTVLVMPALQVSTTEAYQNIKPQTTNQSLEELIKLPIEQWKGQIKNDFEIPVFEKHPTIKVIKEILYACGAVYASMSGSGASVYGIFKNKVDLTELEKDYQVYYGV